MVMLGKYINDLIDLKIKRKEIDNARLNCIALDADKKSYLIPALEEAYQRHINHLSRIDVDLIRLIRKINNIGKDIKP